MSDPNKVQPAPVLAVNFQRPRYERVGPCIYQDGRTGNLYWRPYYQGRQTFRELASRTVRLAVEEVAALRSDLGRSRLGLAKNPLVEVKTLAQLCDFYIAQGCPGKMGPRPDGKQLKEEARRAAWLKKSPLGGREAVELKLDACRVYRDWRVRKVRAGDTGERTVDLELVTLSNVFRCAQRHRHVTGIELNPFSHDRPVFRRRNEVAHCREYRPRDAEELHALARMFFTQRKSEVLGWLTLFQAMLGRRVSEMLRMRVDAKDPTVSGFNDGKRLWFEVKRSHKGTFAWAEIHPALKDCLAAHAAWRELRLISSPWFFPSPYDRQKPIDEAALTKGLQRVAHALKLGPRTSHGLRSYHASVIRQEDNLTAAEVALRLGQKTAGRMVIDVYADILPEKLGWLPKEAAPAWEVLNLTSILVPPQKSEADRKTLEPDNNRK